MTTPEPDPEVRPIHADARHPDDPGESTLTLESGKTIQASDIASRLARNVNETRRSYGYPALAWHEPLASTGRSHAADMFEREYFAHENPEGERAWNRYEKTGYEECVAHGENNYWMSLGYNHSRYETMSATEIERYLAGRINTGFRRSDEGHRELMLSPQYTHLGFAVYLGEDATDESRKGRPYEIYVVEQFCAPKSLRPVAEQRLETYDEPVPNPESTPTPVPIPGELATATPTPVSTPTPDATSTPTSTPASTPAQTASSGQNDAPDFDIEYDAAANTATVVMHDWGDAGALALAFENDFEVFRDEHGQEYVVDVPNGKIHVTVFYPDGTEEKLGWTELE